ncbi:hypothetical protein [Lysinibacillus fusiformis]|uniref:hypothetical protein n=1 Tax=Lysinibacillus fusiformis TaxID=28031 RepID=UPI003D02EE3D
MPERRVNRALRDHVTSANFALVLGSTHIAALVWTDHMLRRNRSFEQDTAEGTHADRQPPGQALHPRAFANHATGMAGLHRRGLVTRLAESHGGEPYQVWGNRTPDEIWEITDAGRLVIGLLAEAGLWAEFGGDDAALTTPAPDRPEATDA